MFAVFICRLWETVTKQDLNGKKFMVPEKRRKKTSESRAQSREIVTTHLKLQQQDLLLIENYF